MQKTQHCRSNRIKFTVLITVFVLIFFGSFMLGKYMITPWELIRIISNRVLEYLQAWSVTDDIPAVRDAHIAKTWSDSAEAVIFNVRFPRVAAAALIGAALSLAGVSYQGMFRNPMVAPDILGASSGAGLGAALAILMGAGYVMISVSAFCTGLIAVFAAYMVGRASKTNPILAMILAGMMVGSLFTAGTSFVKLVADTEQTLPAITYWLMGNLSSIKPLDVQFIIIPMIIGAVPLFLLRWRINLMTVSDEEARSMGINTSAMRAAVIVCATLLTAASVSVSGMIGWVGLVIPHFCRMIFGYDYRHLIPASAMFGAAFLIVVDNAARLMTTGELPIGILTAFIGAPLFMYLIVTGGVMRRGN